MLSLKTSFIPGDTASISRVRIDMFKDLYKELNS